MTNSEQLLFYSADSTDLWPVQKHIQYIDIIKY